MAQVAQAHYESPEQFFTRRHASDKLRFLHRSLMRAKQNGGLLVREKQARQLSKPQTAQRCSHRWPSKHGTIEPSNQKSQMDQEYGLLPADARQQLLVREYHPVQS